jgi:hypothetical protein
MLFELGKGQEVSFATFVTTFESFVVSMFESVVSEAGLGGEFQAAFWVITNERRLLGVDSDVVFKGIGSLESLVAPLIRAAERAIIEVDNAVFSDFGFVFENFTAATKGTTIALFVVLKELLTEVSSLRFRRSHEIKVLELKIEERVHNF